MEIRVLGPVEVIGPHGPVVFRGRLGCVVAALVARRGRAVAVDVLIDDVFGDRPPHAAVSTMHGYVHRVRQRAPSLVGSSASGYRLSDEFEVDADAFEADYRAGMEALRSHDAQRALTCLGSALGRWRGRAYAEYSDREFAETEAVRLEGLRCAAEDERLAVLLDLGRLDEALVELEAAVRAEPSRERRWGMLVEALVRDGRPSEAASAADRFRGWLRDEFGVSPTADFDALEAAVLRAAGGPQHATDHDALDSEVERVIATARATLEAVPVVPISVAGEAALEAGDRLVALGALDAADRWLGEVIQALEERDPGRAARAHLKRADARAHNESGDWLDSVRAAADLAGPLKSTDLLVSAALLNPGGVATGSSTRVELLRSALDQVDAEDPRRPALLAQLAIELVDPSSSREHAALMDAALLGARGHGDEATAVLVAASLLNDSQRYLMPDERAALAAALDEASSRLGRGDGSWLAAAHRYWSAVQLARPADAADALRAIMIREGGRRAFGRVHRFVPHMRAIDALLGGRLDEADALLVESAVAEPVDDVLGLGRGNRHGVLLRLRREQGRLAEMLPLLTRELQPFPGLFVPSDLAFVHAELGHAEAARAALASCRADTLCPPLYLPHLWALRVEAATLAGDPDQAAADAARLRPYVGQVLCGTRGCDGAVDRYLGLAAVMTGDVAAGDRWLASALEIHERLGSPPWVARTLADRARLLDDDAAGARAAALAEQHALVGLTSTLTPGRRAS